MLDRQFEPQNRGIIVISDHSMPGFTGTAALEMARDIISDVPFSLFASGTIGDEIAVNAMREGAKDYIMKGESEPGSSPPYRELRAAQNRRDHKNSEIRMRQLEKFEAIRESFRVGGIAHDFNNVIGADHGMGRIGSG